MSAVAIVVIVLVLFLAIGGFFFYRGYMVGTTQEHTANGLTIVVSKKWFSDYTLNIDGEDIDFTAESPDEIDSQTATYSSDSVTFGNTTIDFNSSTGLVDITVTGETTTTTTTLNAVNGQFVGNSSNVYNYKLENSVLTIEGITITFAKSASAPEVVTAAGSPTTINGETVSYTPDSNVLNVDGVTVTYDSANSMIKVQTEPMASTNPVVTTPAPSVTTKILTLTTDDDNHIITITTEDGVIIKEGGITVEDQNVANNTINVEEFTDSTTTLDNDTYYTFEDSLGNILIFKGDNTEVFYKYDATNEILSEVQLPTTPSLGESCSLTEAVKYYLTDPDNLTFPTAGSLFVINGNSKCVTKKIYSAVIDNVTGKQLKFVTLNNKFEEAYIYIQDSSSTDIIFYDNITYPDYEIGSWACYNDGSSTEYIIFKTDSDGDIENLFKIDLGVTPPLLEAVEIKTTNPDLCEYEQAVVDAIIGSSSIPHDSTLTYMIDSGGKCIEEPSPSS